MRSKAILTPGIVLLTALSLLAVKPSWADLVSADMAYHKGDYKSAFAQYKDMAELGQPTAQFNLAVMYARGQGVMQSFTLAQSWASVAAANGVAPAKALAADLRPQLTPNSLLLSSQIQAQYSQSTLAARLFPQFLQGKEYAGIDPAMRLKAYVPDYPVDAQVQGIQGQVYVEFIVAQDGHARIPHILFALPPGYFETTVINSVLRSDFLPARREGQPIATSTSMMYNFTMRGTSIYDYGDLASRVRKTKKEAETGDPGAEMLYGMMLAGLPQLKKTYDQALPWFLKAAQAGVPYAQYQVGMGLLKGHGCLCDPGKGQIWLEKAAQAGQPDAEVGLAEYLLQDHPPEHAVTAAITWLDRAVSQGNIYGKLRLAAILASNPSADVRDPDRALTLADQAKREYSHDPSLWEIIAAANASRGNYKAAVRDEAHAIALAKRLRWDLTALRQRESRYASGSAWTGNLLAF
ncbi:MAG TPA: energy transducer TonB [Steroidobacteraceae bacterium]|nr:energy transducer TonB [Steroidobacteraceae bacterium]